jgi:hypothetical protein
MTKVLSKWVLKLVPLPADALSPRAVARLAEDEPAVVLGFNDHKSSRRKR